MSGKQLTVLVTVALKLFGEQLFLHLSRPCGEYILWVKESSNQKIKCTQALLSVLARISQLPYHHYSNKET